MYRPPVDVFQFSGDEEMNNTIGATKITDQSRSPWQNIARLTCSDHGLKAGSLIYLQGFATTSYNTLYLIDAVDTNTFDIFMGKRTVTTDTPAGTETAKPIITYDEPWELVGFELHLDTAGGTAENFTVDIDANKGAAWDTNLYTKDMNGVKDIVQNYTQPRQLEANDLVIFGYANTDDRLWGLKVFARRRA